MIIIMTIGESMVHTGWTIDSLPCELLELMKWDKAYIDLNNLAVRTLIKSQYIALPESVDRRLGLIGKVSDQRREGARKLRQSGHRIMPARCRAVTMVTTLRLRNGFPTYSIDPQARGYVDLYDDMPF